jgi:two-component system chemotaxis sensor kinase CheA
MSGLDELRISFFQECEDLLESLGEGLRAMSEMAAGDNAAGDIETVHAVFRAVHSIKGGAGAFGLEDLVTFAHLFETVLDEMRGGKMTIAEGVMHVLLRAGDMLSDLVACARDGVAPDAERMGQLLAELDALADGGGGDDDQAPFEFVPSVVSVDPIELPETTGTPSLPHDSVGRHEAVYSIHFAPKGEFYGTGNEPLALFRALKQLGDLDVACVPGAVPPLSEHDLAEPKLLWALTLVSSAARDEIEAVFEFVADVASLEIATVEDRAELTALKTTSAAHNEGPASSDTVPAPAIVVGGGEATSDPAREIHAPAEIPSAGHDAAGSAAKPAPVAVASPASAAPATIRVNLDRVDRLINLIGELVIMEAMLSQAVESAGPGLRQRCLQRS